MVNDRCINYSCLEEQQNKFALYGAQTLCVDAYETQNKRVSLCTHLLYHPGQDLDLNYLSASTISVCFHEQTDFHNVQRCLTNSKLSNPLFTDTFVLNVLLDRLQIVTIALG